MKLIPKRPPKAVTSELQEEKDKQKEKKRVAALLLAGAQNIPPTPKCQTQTGKKRGGEHPIAGGLNKIGIAHKKQ